MRTEREFSYGGLLIDDAIRHLMRFCANLWQIHAFCEDNTRTVAVFMIKYLRTLGFNVVNDVFAQNSWYFRNALVRANYSNLQKGITETTMYLERHQGEKHHPEEWYLVDLSMVDEIIHRIQEGTILGYVYNAQLQCLQQVEVQTERGS